MLPGRKSSRASAVVKGKDLRKGSRREPVQQAQPQGRARKPCEGHTVSVYGKDLYILFGKHEDDQGVVSCPTLQKLETGQRLPHVCLADGLSAVRPFGKTFDALSALNDTPSTPTP